MSRRSSPTKREILPDPVYHSVVVTKFVNVLMERGKKSTAERILYGALEIVAKKTGEQPLEAFEKALPTCAERGVTMCMEPLTHLETNFCISAEETVRLIDKIGDPNFRLLLDTKAMTFEKEGRAATIRRFGKHLAHYHANDENLNGPGWGDVDFAPIFQALRDINYTGYVSVEVFKFEPGPEAIATKSLEYMKRFV